MSGQVKKDFEIVLPTALINAEDLSFCRLQAVGYILGVIVAYLLQCMRHSCIAATGRKSQGCVRRSLFAPGSFIGARHGRLGVPSGL